MQTRFDIIGSSYEKALLKYPKSRKDESWLIKNLEIDKKDKILEFTAGTGYLTEKIASLVPDGFIVAQDISSIMLRSNKEKCKRYSHVKFYCEKNPFFPKIKNSFFDKAVSLGGFHHIEDPLTILKTINKKIKKGGMCCVGDFADKSPVQKYFDEKINKITPAGHIGFFLSPSRMDNLGRAANFNIGEIREMKVPFSFNTKKEIGEFYNLVHGLRQPVEETITDIQNYLGIKRNGNKLVVPMNYVYVKYIK